MPQQKASFCRHRCSVQGCRQRSSPTISLFRLPKNKAEADEWRELCQIPQTLVEPRICTLHFKEEDYERDLMSELLKLSRRKKLKPLTKPSLRLPKSNKVNVAEILKNDDVLCIVKVSEKKEANCDIEAFAVKEEKVFETVYTKPGVDDISSETESAEDDPLESRKRCPKKARSTRINTRQMKKRNGRKNVRQSGTSPYVKLLEEEVKALKEERKSLEWEKTLLLDEKNNLVSEKQNLVSTVIEKEGELLALREQQKKQELLLINALRVCLTDNQIKIIKSNHKVHAWVQEDFQRGLILYSFSKRTFEFLRNELRFPLPSPATLHQWVLKTFPYPAPFVYDAIQVLGYQVEQNASPDNVCVLFFNKATDTPPGHIPVGQAHLGTLRGILRSWKQPIFYDSNTAITKNILFSAITAVENSGYRIVGVIADTKQSPTFWAPICTGVRNSSFVNPADEQRKVWVMDIPAYYLKPFAEFLNEYKFFREWKKDPA